MTFKKRVKQVLRVIFIILQWLVSKSRSVDYPSLLKSFLIWRSRNINDRQFLLILAVVIGFLSAGASVLLKNATHLVEDLLKGGIENNFTQYPIYAYPIVGIFITFLIIKYVLKEEVGHGIPDALYAISKGNGNINKANIWSFLMTASFTVGFGGSAGLEGPTVGTNTAIGSNLGRILRLNYRTKVLLIACGAAGTIASLFKAPIAAIVFTIEVIMVDLTIGSIVPILLSSATAALVARFFLGGDVLFHFQLKDSFLTQNVPYYIALGVVGGIVAVYFTKVYMAINLWFRKIKVQLLRVLIGGVLLGGILVLFPALYGEGYDTVNALIEGRGVAVMNDSLFSEWSTNQWLVALFVVLLSLVKVIATAITSGAKGVGGIFAPTLFMGAALGYGFALLINQLGWANLSLSNFTLVGMCALMAGVLQAPLTAIFLIAELTGGYELMVPLMVTSTIGFITVKYGTKHTVYTTQLATRGELITHHKDKAVLTLMNLKNEIETDFIRVDPYATLGELVKAVSQARRNLFPVVDTSGYLLGVVTLDDIREIMFDQELYNKKYVHELMSVAPEFIYVTDNMELVMKKFDKSGAWNLPVLEDGIYIGFVSKSKLFTAYRKHLNNMYVPED